MKGAVKTRLAEDVGEDKAFEIYSRLLQITRQETTEVLADKHLFYSTFINNDDEWPSTVYHKHLQIQSDDLGERMLDAFEKIFALDYDEVAIIGSDCPEITTELLNGAFDRLKHCEAVIGPASDGGYYLLGIKKPETILFKHKEWSNKYVLGDTIRTLKGLGYTYELLTELHDIDRKDDLQATAFLETDI